MEVYTYQELSLKNENNAARDLARRLGEYLLQLDSIVFLRLAVDGVEYIWEEACIEGESNLGLQCGRLGESKEFSAKIRTTWGQTLSDRLEYGFLSALKESNLRGSLVYRSTDYYNDDETVDLCLYDEKGLQYPSCEAEVLDSVSDISLWYCNTPEIYFDAGDECANVDLHKSILTLMQEFLRECCVDEDVDERITDSWEDSAELGLEGNIWFKTENIPQMKELLGRMAEAVRLYDSVEFRLNIQAIPDGENDYDFAAVKISSEDDGVKTSCCRF